MVEEKHTLGDLFNDELYLLCVIYLFLRLLKLGVISDPKQYRKNLAITFNKFYISYHFQQVLHQYLYH